MHRIGVLFDLVSTVLIKVAFFKEASWIKWINPLIPPAVRIPSDKELDKHVIGYCSLIPQNGI